MGKVRRKFGYYTFFNQSDTQSQSNIFQAEQTETQSNSNIVQAEQASFFELKFS